MPARPRLRIAGGVDQRALQEKGEVLRSQYSPAEQGGCQELFEGVLCCTTVQGGASGHQKHFVLRFECKKPTKFLFYISVFVNVHSPLVGLRLPDICVLVCWSSITSIA